MFRHIFETVLQRCIDEGLVGGESFGVDASLIPANANQTRGIESKEGLPPNLTACVIDEYLETQDDAAFFAYSTNYMVDLDNAVIVPPRQIALQSLAGQCMSSHRFRSEPPRPSLRSA